MSSSRACFGVAILWLLGTIHVVLAENPPEALASQPDVPTSQSPEKLAQQALELAKQGKPSEILLAEKLLKSARLTEPQSATVLAAAAYTAYQHSKLVASPAKRDLYLEAAESLAKKAIAQDSKIEIAQRTLGLVKLAQDQAKEAVETLRQAVKLEASAVNLTLLAQALLEIDPSNKEAGELVSKALALKSDYNPAHVQQAIILNAAGKTKEAASELNSVTQAARNSQWYVVQGTVFARKGQEQAALEAWMRASAEDPRNPAPYKFKAEHYAKKGNYSLALAEYHMALEHLPNAFPMRQKLAELALAHNDLDVAEAEFKTILDSLPDDPKANLGLARVGFRKYGKDGPFPADFQFFLARLENIIGEAQNPGDFDKLSDERIARLHKRIRPGYSKFVKMIEKHNEHPVDLITLGEAGLFEKEFVDAEKAFTYALAYPETHKRAQDGLDKIEIEKYKNSAENWQPPKLPPSLTNFDSRFDDQGVVLIQQGKLEEAKMALE